MLLTRECKYIYVLLVLKTWKINQAYSVINSINMKQVAVIIFQCLFYCTLCVSVRVCIYIYIYIYTPLKYVAAEATITCILAVHN